MHPLRKFRKDAGFKEAGDLALVFTVNNSRKSKKFLEMRTVIYKIERGYDISRKKTEDFFREMAKLGVFKEEDLVALKYKTLLWKNFPELRNKPEKIDKIAKIIS